MSSAQFEFQAGRPRLTGPLHRIAKPLGPLALPFAGTRWFPLWGVLEHTGRRSGTIYRTPIVALPTADGFIIPLPFGDLTQWAKNLFAANEGAVRSAGKSYLVTDPRVIDLAEAGPLLSGWVRFASARFGLRQFVLVKRTV